MFFFLTVIHVSLLLQPDIQPPSFNYTPLTGLGAIGTLDSEGNFQHRDPFEVINEFAAQYEDFVENDFSQVIQDINSGKRKSNILSALGNFAAFVTSLIALILETKNKNRLTTQ